MNRYSANADNGSGRVHWIERFKIGHEYKEDKDD